ncbi:MAG TPA: hypothetical protein VGK04_04920, partial [Thermoanaerobaculia bacterium]
MRSYGNLDADQTPGQSTFSVLNREILLQFSVDAASDTHDSVQGIDLKLASVQRLVPYQAALGKSDDID